MEHTDQYDTTIVNPTYLRLAKIVSLLVLPIILTFGWFVPVEDRVVLEGEAVNIAALTLEPGLQLSTAGRNVLIVCAVPERVRQKLKPGQRVLFRIQQEPRPKGVGTILAWYTETRPGGAEIQNVLVLPAFDIPLASHAQTAKCIVICGRRSFFSVFGNKG
jgi:hypothetical protein